MKRIVYVNNAKTILASIAERDKLIAWALREKITGFKWYDGYTILANPVLSKALNDVVAYCRYWTTVQDHQMTLAEYKETYTNPFGNTLLNTYDKNYPAKFFNGSPTSGIDLEFEWYLDQYTTAEQLDRFNTWTKAATSNQQKARLSKGIATAYMGQFKPAGHELEQAKVIVSKLQRLDLSVYVPDERYDIMAKYAKDRLSWLGQAQAALYPTAKFKWYPIFSYEPAFFDQQLKTKNYDTIFNDFIKQYDALTFTGKDYLQKPDGYVIFNYTLASALR